MTTVRTPATTAAWHISTLFDPAFITYFIAGGAAGAASRTVVSPLERLKIIQCVMLYLAGGADAMVTREIAGKFNGKPLELAMTASWFLSFVCGKRRYGIVSVYFRRLNFKLQPYGRGWFRGNGINCVR
jgi:hypothetical protein